MWQDRAVFFGMVWEASEWDFAKMEGFTLRLLKFTIDADGNRNKCEEVCEPWNVFCTAKLKEVRQAGVTHSLGRHESHNKARLSTSGSNQDKSLWDHYCGKPPAIRTHASSQATRPPTPTSPASVCVDSNSTRMSETRVEGVRSAIFSRDKE